MRHCLLTIGLALLVGCTQTVPFRTHLSGPQGAGIACSPPIIESSVPASNRNTSYEALPYADLFFVEFDDQGLLYPKTSDSEESQREFGQASCHLDSLIAGLESLARTQPLSILVYVHGWKHNADASDRDVKKFRQLLEGAALVEQAKSSKFGGKAHRVVGIYVAWRGKSLDLPEPLINASFWDRKNTADDIAQGESRALFSRLRAFQTAQNQNADKSGLAESPFNAKSLTLTESGERLNKPLRSASEAQKLPFTEKHVLLILIGHSFGGLIIYNSVAQSLLSSLYEAADDERGKKVMSRFADMIIIANPAVEALRYTPLHRAAGVSTFKEYQTPVFVSITSQADRATRYAFPAGRYLTTMFHTYASEEERKANRTTLGHMSSYITHRLELGANASVCGDGWVAGTDKSPLTREQAVGNLALEIENSKKFFNQLPTGSGWVRQFCGNTKLTHVSGHLYSPIWNVQTTGAIVPDHSEITQPVFISFVRQLYHDVVLSEIVNPKGR